MLWSQQNAMPIFYFSEEQISTKSEILVSSVENYTINYKNN